jgi:hypothetical protein
VGTTHSPYSGNEGLTMRPAERGRLGLAALYACEM